MSGFDRILEGIKAVLLATEEIKRLSAGVQALSGEVRDIDRRVSRLEGIVVGQAQAASTLRRRLPKKTD
jgi:hypothetical protein